MSMSLIIVAGKSTRSSFRSVSGWRMHISGEDTSLEMSC